MTNSDKKQIIDRMFGFSILNDMQRSVKEARKNLKIDLDVYDRELKQINENIVSVNMKLNQLKAESNEKNKAQIQELKDRLTSLAEDKKKLSEAQEKITASLGTFNEDLGTKQHDKSQLEFELESLRKKVALYESNACPTCESPLTGDFHQERKKELEAKIQSIPDKIKEASVDIDAIQTRIREMREKDRTVRDRVSSMNTTITSLKQELIKINDNLNNGNDFDHLTQIIKDFEEQEKTKVQDNTKISGEYNFLEALEEILGEDGVKNLAIQTILPGLNANVAAMGQTMHLPFHIRFNDKFDCIINHLGEEINPLTLSTGERKKADFIVIIAIIKILKLRFPQLNLLFLDELLSSVDADGVHNILKILSQVIKESNINTFVINHTVLPHELFDKKIQIYRENGFSKFEIESIE